MVESTMQGVERQNGNVARNLTTHSTGARVSLSFIENLNYFGGSSRPVNSGVMLLNS